MAQLRFILEYPVQSFRFDPAERKDVHGEPWNTLHKLMKINFLLAVAFFAAFLFAAAADSGKVTITSPKENQVFSSGNVTIEWIVDLGKEGNHVHLYLDGKLIGREYRNSLTLENLKPGTHTVEVRLASKWYSELGPKADVTFKINGNG